MNNFSNDIREYRTQLKKGQIQKAYKGLMQYYKDLRSHFQLQYPDYSVPTNIYFGNMDITFFSFSPPSLKSRSLKILIVFLHNTFQFELWLAGNNKSFQSKYVKLLRENNWKKYPIAASTKGVDYISKCTLVEEPDFSNLDALTKTIEQGAQLFIDDFESFLALTTK